MASLPHHGVVAEIGVADGDFSAEILRLNQPRELWLIDSWKLWPDDVVGFDPSNAPQHVQDDRYNNVRRRFENNSEVHVLRECSVYATAHFEDFHFDGIYIDANHLQVIGDIQVWWTKVKVGGWIAGHDYTNAGNYITVKKDIDTFVQDLRLDLVVTQGGDDIYERNYPSWLFWKP
jgi:hypothetical protein